MTAKSESETGENYAAEQLRKQIASAIVPLYMPFAREDGAVVLTTACIYTTRAPLHIVFRQSKQGNLLVTDDGQGVIQLVRAGWEMPDDQRDHMIRQALKANGYYPAADVRDGNIFAVLTGKRWESTAVGGSIMLVANASIVTVAWIMAHIPAEIAKRTLQ